MEIQLTAKHLKITEPIRNYVRQKMEKAQKYFDHIIWGQAFVHIDKRAHNAELVIHAPGQTFRALATAADLYSAIDLASDKIDGQLKRYKERLKSRHKTHKGKEEVISAEEAAALLPMPSAIQYSIVKQPLVPMSPEQAALEMETAGQSFRLYQDRQSKQVHVIFRRSDDSYGILQPVKGR
ncbi:MAG: ribosome-associated translation inhibitor RaiA [Elusimicrobiota bacterium]